MLVPERHCDCRLLHVQLQKHPSTVSSAAGGEMNDTDEGKDEGRESKDKEKSGEMKGSKEAGLCSRLCVFMNTSVSNIKKKTAKRN